MNPSTLGTSLHFLRILKAKSLRDVAEILGRSHTFLARVENGELSISQDDLTRLNQVYGTSLRLAVSHNDGWHEWIEAVYQDFLNGDLNAFYGHQATLQSYAQRVLDGPLHFQYHAMHWVLCVMTRSANTVRVLKMEPVFSKLTEKTRGPLGFLLRMTLFRVAYRTWQLKSANAWLDDAVKIVAHPHLKAVIQLQKAEIGFHRYNRQGALKVNKEAHQTFGFFNNVLRRAEAEIRSELYKKRQLKSDEVDYASLKDKAKTFLLPNLYDEIVVTEGLRAQHLGFLDRATHLLGRLPAAHPQYYFYQAMNYHVRADYHALTDHLKTPPKDYVIPVVFQHGLEFLKAVVEASQPDVIERHLLAYLDAALDQQLYGETRWAQLELSKLYEQTRRYKAATQMVEKITNTIMQA